MNTKNFYSALALIFLIVISCEKEILTIENSLNDKTLTLVEDEVFADISFVELLDEGDDGIFWGDDGFLNLKSGVDKPRCATKEITNEDNKRTVTLDFSGSDCGKSGVIVIIYQRPVDKKRSAEKTIKYIDFSNENGTVFNGVKSIMRKDRGVEIKSEITAVKLNKEGEEITFIRNSSREVKTVCFKNNEIRKVTGNTQVSKIKGETEESYNKEIMKPLLVVKACDLKVQAGLVKITKADGSEIQLNYGRMPQEINCDSVFSCETTFKVNKNGKTTIVTYEKGKGVNRNKNNK